MKCRYSHLVPHFMTKVFNKDIQTLEPMPEEDRSVRRHNVYNLSHMSVHLLRMEAPPGEEDEYWIKYGSFFTFLKRTHNNVNNEERIRQCIESVANDPPAQCFHQWKYTALPMISGAPDSATFMAFVTRLIARSKFGDAEKKRYVNLFRIANT